MTKAGIQKVMPMRIRRAIVESGKTDLQLIAETGIDQSTFSRVRNGNRIPSHWDLAAIAEATGKSVDFFYGRSEE